MKIEVLGKAGCPPCNELKMVLSLAMKEFDFHLATERSETITKLKKALTANAGMRPSLPALWVDGELVAMGQPAVDYAKKDLME